MKKMICFIIICLYVVGLLGGVGYCVYNRAWVVAVGVAVLGLTGWPTARDCLDELTE